MVDEPEEESETTDTNSIFVYTEFLNILEAAQTNASVKKALENLLLIYYTIKHGKE
jgi:hypothetical protein